MAVQKKPSFDARSQQQRPPRSPPPTTDGPASDSDGYDAEDGPLHAGLASRTVALDDVLDNAADEAESSSIDADELGSHTLRAATQQDGLGSVEEEDFDDETALEPAGVDLAQNTIRSGSLFDQPRKDAPGEVRHPLVRSNEVDATLEQNARARRARSGGR